jgi:hypothetical protein
MTPRALSFVLFILVGAAVVGYGVFEAHKLVEGPIITIDYPDNGSATSSTEVIISGTAENISFLTIDGVQAYTDEAGHFYEDLTPAPGYTILTVAAKDRFGRSVSKEIAINVLGYCSLS